MYTNIDDIVSDAYEIKGLVKTLRQAFESNEEDQKYPYHIEYLIKIIDEKVNNFTCGFDKFIFCQEDYYTANLK